MQPHKTSAPHPIQHRPRGITISGEMAGKRPAKKLRLFHGLMRNQFEEWQSNTGDVAVTFTIPLFSAVNRGKPRGGDRNVQEGGGAEGGGGGSGEASGSRGNDGRGAVREIQRIAQGYPFKQVAEPIIARGEVTAAHLADCKELGMTLAAGLELGIF